MKINPKISIITVVLNDVKSIAITIESVLNQTFFKEIEYVVIDGGSTDGTAEKIRNYAANLDHFVSEPDKGLYDAMNKGLSHATGEYILFINSGDSLYDPMVIENIFSNHIESDVYYGETMLVDTENNEIGTRSDFTTRKLPVSLTSRDFLKGMVVSHQSFITKKDICGLFDKNYICSADIDWCISILKKSQVNTNCNLVISRFQLGGLSEKHRKICWKERFIVFLSHFGIYDAIVSYLKIIFRFMAYKISGRPNLT